MIITLKIIKGIKINFTLINAKTFNYVKHSLKERYL